MPCGIDPEKIDIKSKATECAERDGISAEKGGLIKTIISIPANIAIVFVKFYRKFISPLKPPCCRFTPTCSQYSIEAIQKHGFIKGVILTLYRLARCQPLCKGGHDPVPEKKKKKEK